MTIPTVGRIVHYTLSHDDAEKINRRRTTGVSIAARIKQELWPIGAQAHIGNPVQADDVYPAIITRAWAPEPNSCVELQVFLAGNDVFWASSVQVGECAGTFKWPFKP